MRKIYQELEKEYDREPTTAEIAEAMELSKDEIEDTIMAAAKELSMDGISGDEDEASLLDVLPATNVIDPEDSLDEESLHMEVEGALSVLSKREADIIRSYFGLDAEQAMTLEQIGDEYNLTRERIRQIKEKALSKLRHTSRTRILKKYLGE
jgi:RNA polymerase primary sigma factor